MTLIALQHYKLSQTCSTDAGYSCVHKYPSLSGTQLLRTGIYTKLVLFSLAMGTYKEIQNKHN